MSSLQHYFFFFSFSSSFILQSCLINSTFLSLGSRDEDMPYARPTRKGFHCLFFNSADIRFNLNIQRHISFSMDRT
jgi:hypothetical protein